MSAASSSRRSNLKSQHEQGEWLVKLENYGVRHAGLKETSERRQAWGLDRDRLRVEGITDDEKRESILEALLSDEVTPLDRLLADQSIDLTPFNSSILPLRAAIQAFTTVDSTLSEEDAWTDPVKALFTSVFKSTLAVVSNHNCKIAAAVLNILNVPDLRPVKPDLLIGLASERIRIAQSASLPSLHVAIKSYLFERGHVAYEISQYILSDHFFSFFFVELKGPSGSAGEARIQNSIACNVSLRMHLHLAKLARNADPDSFRPPGEMMLRVYGLQTGGGGSQWKLVVAVADVGRNTTEGMGRLDPVAELDEAENALELRSVTHFTLWSGDVLDPSSLVSFVDILQKIRLEVEERHNYVGNWLYCLRERGAKTESSKEKVRVGVEEGGVTGEDQDMPQSKRPRRNPEGKPKNRRGSPKTKGGRSAVQRSKRANQLDLDSEYAVSDSSKVYSWMMEIQAVS